MHMGNLFNSRNTSLVATARIARRMQRRVGGIQNYSVSRESVAWNSHSVRRRWTRRPKTVCAEHLHKFRKEVIRRTLRPLWRRSPGHLSSVRNRALPQMGRRFYIFLNATGVPEQVQRATKRMEKENREKRRKAAERGKNMVQRRATTE